LRDRRKGRASHAPPCRAFAGRRDRAEFVACIGRRATRGLDRHGQRRRGSSACTPVARSGTPMRTALAKLAAICATVHSVGETADARPSHHSLRRPDRPSLPPVFLSLLAPLCSPSRFRLLCPMKGVFSSLTLAVVPPDPHPYGGRHVNHPALGAPFPSLPPRRSPPAHGYTFLAGTHVTSPPVSTALPGERPFLQGASTLPTASGHALPLNDAAAAASGGGAGRAHTPPGRGRGGMTAPLPMAIANAASLPGSTTVSGLTSAAGVRTVAAAACAGGSSLAGVPPPALTRRSISPSADFRGGSD